MSRRLSLCFAVVEANGTERDLGLKGQYARTMRALIEAGAKGITALDVSGTWALRLSHYVFVLRREHGLSITTDWEPHDGASGPGRHGRYRLHTPAQLIGGCEQEAA